MFKQMVSFIIMAFPVLIFVSDTPQQKATAECTSRKASKRAFFKKCESVLELCEQHKQIAAQLAQLKIDLSEELAAENKETEASYSRMDERLSRIDAILNQYTK